MRKKNVLALLLVLVMAASVALTGCNKPKTPSGDQGSAKLDADQHLNVPLVTEIKTLDSSKTTDVYSATVQLNTQEGLIRVTNDGEKDIIEKAGAESWDVSPDGLTWTFHLRDYKWSDNKPVTAGDYEYAWKRLLDPATKAGYSYLITDKIVGAADFNAGKGSADAVGIKATDDKTLEVKLVKPVAYFDKMLGMQGLLPLRKDIVEAGGETYGQDPSKLV
ncbi:MAG TPA: peptide ABC transporter substrate-binding protein, partial [Clostridiaceae bacterium]|nr:peptide ABC transporter substrate-binding protein [Clostridiaceae bacterium]